MSQTNIREGYRITTLEIIKLIEDLISYLLKSLRLLTLKDWLAVAKCIQLRNVQILKYSAKVKIEDLSNTLTLTLSKTAQRRSSSVVSNRSTALITNKFSVALLTKLAILNNANIALVDAVHYSVVIDALMMTLIKNDDDLLGTVNSYIKPPLKRRKKAQLKKTRDEEELAKLDSLLDSDDYCLDSSLDINSKDNLKDEEATIAKNLLIDAYILYFKELLSNNGGIFANAIGIGKTQAIVLAIEVQNARAEGNAIEYNAVNDDDKLYPTKGERTFYCCDLSNPLALRFCFFSNSPPENIGRLMKEEAIEMRINTTNAISKALAAANKLVALQSYVLGGFMIVCSFRKVDKYVFRAYNTISVIAQRTIIRKGGSYIKKRAILLPNILEKEGLNKLEASRRVIFNCFKMQAIASYSTLATLKAVQFKIYSSCKVKRFTLNSVKDLFTNLSKDYFLVREALALIAFAEAIILTEATHVVIIEPQDSIVYFNLDSKLKLKVLGKQDVKTTS
ncbi:hypothetical protein HBI79_141940 [Parastagonospora nodorum]|nr:hypothetical protein HBI79_141940 [Parastagonospora nodorum]